MSKRRPIIVSNPVSDREMEKVFVTAPFTKLGSSVDLFILKLTEGWGKQRRGHRSNPSEILHLSLADIVSHHPVAREHFEYYSNIGEKCGVQLAEPIFENFWLFWITNETIQASCNAADQLQRAFQIRPSSDAKRTDRYKWEDIARLVLRPSDSIKAKPAHVETLLRNVRPIADAVSATRDLEQFYIACAIEWIDSRLKKDPLKKKAQREVLLAALDNAKEKPLGEPSEQTASALQLLVDTYPKAFTDELNPMSIAHIVQLLTESRTRKLKPVTVLRIFNSIDRTSETATLISFVLATSLGIELTNQLIRVAGQDHVTEINWDLSV